VIVPTIAELPLDPFGQIDLARRLVETK